MFSYVQFGFETLLNVTLLIGCVVQFFRTLLKLGGLEASCCFILALFS